jgi:hypothetical protein
MMRSADVRARLRRLGVVLEPFLARHPRLDVRIRDVMASLSYGRERALLRGEMDGGLRAPRSILHFTVNKSATQFVKRVLVALCEPQGLRHVDLAAYTFSSSAEDLAQSMLLAESSPYQRAFRERGFLYSALGEFLPVTGLERYRVLLVIRDPRDVLVSKFHSMASVHRLPHPNHREAFLRERAQAQRLGIDRYVIDAVDGIRKIYMDYWEKLLAPYRESVAVARYEDMISDFPSWLSTLCDALDLSAPPATAAAVVRRAEMEREGLGPNYKRRAVVAGQYRSALAPSTVQAIDRDLASVLEVYGYA